MRILLDTCVWGKAGELLRNEGHDVVWVGDWPNDPGDTEILRTAAEQRRILVTLDKDFGELAVFHGEAHCGIVRLVGISARLQGGAVLEVLKRLPEELAQRAVITVEPGRVRVRSAGEPESRR